MFFYLRLLILFKAGDRGRLGQGEQLRPDPDLLLQAGLDQELVFIRLIFFFICLIFYNCLIRDIFFYLLDLLYCCLIRDMSPRDVRLLVHAEEELSQTKVGFLTPQVLQEDLQASWPKLEITYL